MADFILELYSEEMPASLQTRAAEDLLRLISERLAEHDIKLENPRTYFAPQRLALLATDIPVRTQGRKTEKKGPKVDAPAPAIQGFLRANRLDNTDSLTVCEHPKGDYYLFKNHVPAQSMAALLATIIPSIIMSFPWPKSMRWGRGKLRWVRPLRSILCRFDGAVIAFEVDGLASSGVSFGHRFMVPGAIEIKTSADYLSKLEAAKVMADSTQRQQVILEQATVLAKNEGLELIADAALVKETAGLVEWPVALMGKIDDEFMDIAEEVLISVMRTHQKYFTLRDPKTRRLAPRFITISNMETKDKGAMIIAGNERVLRARLSDGKFFWEQDRKISLEERLPDLGKIIFHAKLGTVLEKTQRLEKLSVSLSKALNANSDMAKQAARLCKADLVSSMVYEFPDLQGVMGGYYVGDEKLGAAIRDHYRPLGPSDNIPETAEGCVVALADKIDTLMGFWKIDEKPTGSKDPFALRRAALGIIRILSEKEARLPLMAVFEQALLLHGGGENTILSGELLGFMHDRLKVYLRDQGIGHDVVNAIFNETSDDIFDLGVRAKKLTAFLSTDDGANLLATYKRARGILAKAGDTGTKIQPELLRVSQEQKLNQAINALDVLEHPDLHKLDAYENYLDSLSTLRAPVDAFFEAVMVNDENAEIRQNRLNLLRALVAKMHRVADFGCIE